MTELDKLIATVYANEGRNIEDVNKVYLTLLRTPLFIPIELSNTENEDFKPLFAYDDKFIFMAVFDSLERLQHWAGDYISKIDYTILSGKEVISGLGEEVHLALNIGSEFYKEFSPDEIKRLKKITAKIQSLS